MPSVEELLNQDSDDEYIDISLINDVITIDPETRTINLPASETLFGTEQEMDVERKYFKCPKIVGDNIDLSKHQIYITYVTAKDNIGTFLPDEELGLYYCEDMEVDGDYITFSWLLSGNVLRNHGFIAFAVSAKHMDGEVLKTRWKTKPAVGTVLLTVPDGASQIVEAYPDIIAQLLEKISSLSEEKVENPLTGVVGQILEIETVDESGKPKTYKAVNKPSGVGEVTDEQISNAVDNYMTAHPFTETDPTVPDWAKHPEKPTYTASEVGALPIGTKIPSKTSDLQNDSGFLTEHQDLSDYALKSEVPKSASDVGADASGTAESKVSEHNISDIAHNDICLLVQGLTTRLNALADSDDTTLDQMSEVVAYIKSNKSLIDAITTSKINVSDIINNLTTNLSNKVLSASMGVELKKLIDAIKVPVNLSELAGDTTHRTVTDAEKNSLE